MIALAAGRCAPPQMGCWDAGSVNLRSTPCMAVMHARPGIPIQLHPTMELNSTAVAIAAIIVLF